MHKILLIVGLWLLMQTLVMAKENSKIEVTAKYIEIINNRLIAKEGVVVYYQNALLKADVVSYDKKKKLLTLDGHVESVGYKGTKEYAEHMEIKTGSKEVHFEKLFFVSKNDVWLYAQTAMQKDGNYTLGASVLSSCEIDDPLWKMMFSRSTYDSQKQYIKLYDTKVYFKTIPIFYMPYMAFSTNQKRSSGLLFPLFGYTAEEGFLYEQPIYWAISPSMDLELNPQIRLRRNLGLYGTLRFVDSPHSKGELRLGYFQDFDSYQQREETEELKHYGLEFNYDSSMIFSQHFSSSFVDGLYVNTTFLNDIEYLNLQKTRLEHFGLLPLQESRFNYFLQNETYYAGLNAKYFIDTRKEHNEDTIQILPALQLHKYVDTLLWQHLTYSIDMQTKHLYREKGLRLKQFEAKLPFVWNQSFFNDAFSLSLEETVYYSKYFFENGLDDYSDFSYYSNIHSINISTDLTKSYQNYIHVLQPSLRYVYPGNENESPLAFKNLSAEQKELFAVGLPEKHLLLSLNHYLYNNAMQLIFYQRFSQSYYTDRSDKFADLHNEMQYNWRNWRFYSDVMYAPQYGKLRSSSSRVALKEDTFALSFGHIYKQILPDQIDTQASNNLEFAFSYDVNPHVSLSGELIYNLDNHSSKLWKVGGGYHQDCWNVDLYLKQDVTPRPTGFTTDSSFYVQFNFVPFGGAGSLK